MADNEKKSRSIAVVGGGIIGCSTAYFLTKRGYRNVVVYEAVSVAHAASGRAGGFLALDWCDRQGQVKELARRGFELHSQLSNQLGTDVGYRKMKTLSLNVSGVKNEKLGRKLGKVPEWVDGNVISSDQIGTEETTAQVHPRLLTRALMAAAERDGGARVENIGVVDARLWNEENQRPAGKGGVTLNLEDGTSVDADIVILTMGPWTGKGLSWFGKSAAITGARAHSILLKSVESIDNTALFLDYKENYSSKSLDPEVYPRSDGTVYVCGSGDREPLPEHPRDVKADPKANQQLRRVAGKVASQLEYAPTVDNSGKDLPGPSVGESACYLPMAVDHGGPLMGAVPGCPGVFVAAGHYCWGILQGPASGEVMAELIDTGKTSIDIDEFSPARVIK